MKNKIVIKSFFIVIFILIIMVILVNVLKTEYKYSGVVDMQHIEVKIKDYKIFKYIESEAKDDKGNRIKKRVVISIGEFNNIRKTAELMNENSEGYRYLDSNEFVKYLNILAHGNDVYVTKNILTKEEERHNSRSYADDYFSMAYKEFEFNVPSEYVRAYVKKFANGIREDMSNEAVIGVFRNCVDMKFVDYMSSKKYIKYIDVTENEDGSMKIRYYGIVRNVFEGSFVQKDVLRKLDGTTVTTELKYDSEKKEWSYSQGVN